MLGSAVTTKLKRQREEVLPLEATEEKQASKCNPGLGLVE